MDRPNNVPWRLGLLCCLLISDILPFFESTNNALYCAHYFFCLICLFNVKLLLLMLFKVIKHYQMMNYLDNIISSQLFSLIKIQIIPPLLLIKNRFKNVDIIIRNAFSSSISCSCCFFFFSSSPNPFKDFTKIKFLNISPLDESENSSLHWLCGVALFYNRRKRKSKNVDSIEDIGSSYVHTHTYIFLPPH